MYFKEEIASVGFFYKDYYVEITKEEDNLSWTGRIYRATTKEYVTDVFGHSLEVVYSNVLSLIDEWVEETVKIMEVSNNKPSRQTIYVALRSPSLPEDIRLESSGYTLAEIETFNEEDYDSLVEEVWHKSMADYISQKRTKRFLEKEGSLE